MHSIMAREKEDTRSRTKTGHISYKKPTAKAITFIPNRRFVTLGIGSKSGKHD